MSPFLTESNRGTTGELHLNDRKTVVPLRAFEVAEYLPGDGWKASSKCLSVGSGIYRRTMLPSLLGNPFYNKGQRVLGLWHSRRKVIQIIQHKEESHFLFVQFKGLCFSYQ